MKPESENNPEYDIFKENEAYTTLEVTEQAPRNYEPVVPTPPKRRKRKGRLFQSALAGVVIIALIISSIALFRSGKKPETSITINTQSLDNGTLNQLATEAGGEVKQQLTISPDTLFENSVTVNKDLTVRGQTFLQSPVSITRDLAIGGNTSIGGNLSVTGQISAGNLNVGSIEINSLRLSGNLEFNGHITPTGAVPAIRASTASAGGSATIDGNDTAGTITIVIGGGGISTGEMAVINFRTAFTGTPKIQLTPVSNAASKLDYFITRSAGFFTIEATSLPIAGGTYSFDYLVTQ